VDTGPWGKGFSVMEDIPITEAGCKIPTAGIK